jgi:hypothetical protein
MKTDFDYAQSDSHPERSRRVFVIKMFINFVIETALIYLKNDATKKPDYSNSAVGTEYG